MDILQQYEKQTSVQRSQRELSQEYGFLARLVMRLSGDKIQDARQQKIALLGVLGVLVVLAFIIFFVNGDTRPSVSSKDLRLTPPSRAITP